MSGNAQRIVRATIPMGSHLAVADQIQAFALGRKTGVLHIFHSDRSGMIFLMNGEVVDAVFGGRRGVQAAIDMINLPNPPTAFTLDEGTKYRTIRLSYVELLLDAARYQDQTAGAPLGEHPAAPAAPTLKYWLDGVEHTYQMDQPVAHVGRARGNDVVIAEASVSRRHARLEWHDFGVLLRDMDSGNGTFVFGRRVRDLLLQAGDEVRFGQVAAQYVIEDLVELSPARPAPGMFAVRHAAGQATVPVELGRESAPEETAGGG